MELRRKHIYLTLTVWFGLLFWIYNWQDMVMLVVCWDVLIQVSNFQKSFFHHIQCWLNQCSVMWPLLWNFNVRHLKFNRFLLPNKCPERICLFVVIQFVLELVQIEHILKKLNVIRIIQNIHAFNESCFSNLILK